MMEFKLYILRQPKSELLSVFSVIMDINFGFASLRLSLALLLYFLGVVIMRSYQKKSIRKTSNFLWEHKLKGSFQHSPQTQIIIIKESQEDWKLRKRS